MSGTVIQLIDMRQNYRRIPITKRYFMRVIAPDIFGYGIAFASQGLQNFFGQRKASPLQILAAKNFF